MCRWTWWMIGVGALLAGCGGKAVDVLETPEDARTDGDGSAIPNNGGACMSSEDCGAFQVCHPDGQCHPAPAACGQHTCGTDEAGDCACQWTCTDAIEYQARCRLTEMGLVTCNCAMDGVDFDWTCVLEEPTTDACGLGAACCTFPE